MNLYAFVGNGPVGRWDVLGMSFERSMAQARAWGFNVGSPAQAPHLHSGFDPSGYIPRFFRGLVGSLAISSGYGYESSGCAYIGANGFVCIAGSIKHETGSCCIGRRRRVRFHRAAGSIALSAGVQTNPSFTVWSHTPVASFDIGFIGRCPPRREFSPHWSGEIKGTISAGYLAISYDIDTGDVSWRAGIESGHTFTLISLSSSAALSVDYFEYLIP